MNSQLESKAEISANLQANAKISSILKASSDVLLARGVGFEPTRPLPATDLAGLPPTRLGQPRPDFQQPPQVFARFLSLFRPDFR